MHTFMTADWHHQSLIVGNTCILWAGLGGVCGLQAAPPATRTPVVELYTSEACSSCPHADCWLSSLKGKATVAKDRYIAYWTVTENGHRSRVKAGESAGELLKHDVVARPYVTVGLYQVPETLRLAAIPVNLSYPRQVRVGASNSRTGETLQPLSLQCC
ncbi:DUF1223 domain-containing protein [Rhodoferax sediminis]|uniref:DUF1223 domain-containing protein n=1 Tax=Rhodoferax aquaticus TaxID=2527691 RepID=A0A515EP12_9BURK|nr:DUF1223 domain-containing protein [Rhodoferax aquaticus]